VPRYAVWEADFDDSSYGFRPKRSAADAVGQIKENLKSGMHDVYDADLSKYFDTIPHDKLEVALKERITDPRVIHLIKLWLKVPIVEEDGRYTGGKRHKMGTPQGGVISPLLANIYMNLLDRIVNKAGGYFARQGIKMIRYRVTRHELCRRLHTDVEAYRTGFSGQVTPLHKQNGSDHQCREEQEG